MTRSPESSFCRRSLIEGTFPAQASAESQRACWGKETNPSNWIYPMLLARQSQLVCGRDASRFPSHQTWRQSTRRENQLSSSDEKSNSTF